MQGTKINVSRVRSIHLFPAPSPFPFHSFPDNPIWIPVATGPLSFFCEELQRRLLRAVVRDIRIRQLGNSSLSLWRPLFAAFAAILATGCVLIGFEREGRGASAEDERELESTPDCERIAPGVYRDGGLHPRYSILIRHVGNLNLFHA